MIFRCNMNHNCTYFQTPELKRELKPRLANITWMPRKAIFLHTLGSHHDRRTPFDAQDNGQARGGLNCGYS